jgi:hypothetical protein
MTVDGHLVNPQVLQSLYGHVPDLSVARIRSINVNAMGPSVTLRIDVPSFPRSQSEEWLAAGVDTVQCHLQFLAVTRFSLTEWVPPATGRIAMQPGAGGCAQVTINGPGVAMEMGCSAVVKVAHVSAYRAAPDGTDSGRHVFVGKVDARRYDALPDTYEKAFYAR